MGKTNISWADYSWNPIIGCSKVSAGCQNCYAERMAYRLKRLGRPEYQDVVDDDGHWTGVVKLVEKRVEEPLHWRKPRRVFVCSMSDLFHPQLPYPSIWEIKRIIHCSPQHTFMVLTKRPRRMPELAEMFALFTKDNPAPNIWLGVSVENEDNLWRIDELLKIPAAVHWVSLEPMLEGIDLTPWLDICTDDCGVPKPRHEHCWAACEFCQGYRPRLNWVVIGAESGPNRRPFKEEWAWDVLYQCREAGVPCFLKQGPGPRPGVPLLDRGGRKVKEFPK